MRQVLAMICVLSVPSGAAAADWQFVANCGEQPQQRAYSYDADTLQRRRGKVTVRLKGDYSQVAGSRSKEAALVWSIDCANRTYVERARTEYDAARKIAAKYRKPTAAMGITPDSVAEKVFARVCA